MNKKLPWDRAAFTGSNYINVVTLHLNMKREMLVEV